MNIQTIFVAIIAVLVGGISGYVIGYNDKVFDNQTDDHAIDYHTHDTEEVDAVPEGMHRAPDGTIVKNSNASPEEIQHTMSMAVSSEREFIEGMIPHHQEAVDTAKEVMERGGTTPEIRQFVENIIMVQEAEIAKMKQWHQEWYGEQFMETGAYMPMMRELESLSGSELDRAFLEDMIRHHVGAIIMAQSVRMHIEHNELIEFSQAIVSTQTAEIADMRVLLEAL